MFSDLVVDDDDDEDDCIITHVIPATDQPSTSHFRFGNIKEENAGKSL